MIDSEFLSYCYIKKEIQGMIDSDNYELSIETSLLKKKFGYSGNTLVTTAFVCQILVELDVSFFYSNRQISFSYKNKAYGIEIDMNEVRSALLRHLRGGNE